SCEALQNMDFTGLQDAPTQITTSSIEAALDEEDVPSHCLVRGYVSPNVAVRLHMPIPSEWNGNSLEASPGGYGGAAEAMDPWCREAMRRGYACVGHDTGHTGSMPRALWAYNNLQAELDYGIRGHYVAALAGKAIVETYYGIAPEYSYHVGCSGGGKQGMVEAQRFPWNFDGILAIEPSNVTGSGIIIHWNAMVTH